MKGVSTTLNPGPWTSALVVAIEPEGPASRLVTSTGAGRVEVTVPAVADTEAAKRWLAVFRRVHRVEIRITGVGVSALVDGVGHRLPFMRHMPLAAAVGLGVLGVPVFFRKEQR